MIRRDDTVFILAGKERGKTGKVLKVIPERNRAIIEKMNIVKRHTKPTPQMRQGGIVDKEASIHLSNLVPFCDKCKKPVRVRMAVDKKGSKFRACHRCGEKVGV